MGTNLVHRELFSTSFSMFVSSVVSLALVFITGALGQNLNLQTFRENFRRNQLMGSPKEELKKYIPTYGVREPTNSPITCPSETPTIPDTGDNFIPDAPLRIEFCPQEQRMRSTLIVTGFIHFNCGKTPGKYFAVDVWMPDLNGQFTNLSRGKIIADEAGKFSLITAFPGQYKDEPRHMYLRISGRYGMGIYKIYFANDPYWKNKELPANAYNDVLISDNVRKAELHIHVGFGGFNI